MYASLDETGPTLLASSAPVISVADELMAEPKTTSADTASSGGTVCPFCAHIRTDPVGSCPKCTMEDTPSTRRSTGERIGPWFVLQRKNPTAPGLRLSVLLTLARRGHVTPKSIVRGPTTGQFWKFASQVKGLSSVFGICWHCGASVSPEATTCPKCRSAQDMPEDPDQFLENHAAIPVMREIPLQELEAADPYDLPERPTRRLPEPRAPRGDLSLRPQRGIEDSIQAGPNTPGTRSMTLARGEDDVILSASELAAAFQLDMPADARRPKRRLRRVAKYLFLIALLLAGGTATAFYLKPQWYQQSMEYARPYVEKGQTWLAKVTGKSPRKPSTLEDTSGLPPITPIELKPAPETKAVDAPGGDLAGKTVTDNTDSKPRVHPTGTLLTPPVDPNAPIDALGGGTSMFVPSTRPIPSSAQVAEMPNLIKSILGNQESAQNNTPVNTDPPVTPAPTEKDDKPAVDLSKLSLEEAIATAATLRTSALDAEARKDWAAAVLIYEQIEKLPEGARPSDLKVKLAVARERARP